MKINHKIASILTLLFFYGVALSLTYSNVYQPAHTQKIQSSESYVASLSMDQIGYGAQTEHSFSVQSASTNHSKKEEFKPFSIVHRAQSILLKSWFNQLRYVLLDFKVKHRKADILYPFHYFW